MWLELDLPQALGLSSTCSAGESKPWYLQVYGTSASSQVTTSLLAAMPKKDEGWFGNSLGRKKQTNPRWKQFLLELAL